MYGYSRLVLLAAFNWLGTLLVHDTYETPLDGATVSGSWSTGVTDACVTGAAGACQISLSGLNTKTANVTFTVTNLTQSSLVYQASSNHDPDGDSDGTTITVSAP